jgi:hypothetical protein
LDSHSPSHTEQGDESTSDTTTISRSDRAAKRARLDSNAETNWAAVPMSQECTASLQQLFAQGSEDANSVASRRALLPKYRDVWEQYTALSRELGGGDAVMMDTTRQSDNGRGVSTSELSSTLAGMISILDKVQQLHPRYQLTQHSRFIDLGSGFGWPTFAAHFVYECEAMGIEYVPQRAQLCQQVDPSSHCIASSWYQHDLSFYAANVFSFLLLLCFIVCDSLLIMFGTPNPVISFIPFVLLVVSTL